MLAHLEAMPAQEYRMAKIVTLHMALHDKLLVHVMLPESANQCATQRHVQTNLQTLACMQHTATPSMFLHPPHLVPDMECTQPGDDVQVDREHPVCVIIVAQRACLLTQPVGHDNTFSRIS